MVRGLFDLLSQFIPLLLTFVMAASSYWYATQTEISLFKTRGEQDPTVSDYYLRNFSVQSHNLATGQYAMISSKAAEHIPQGDVWNITRPVIQQYNAQGTQTQGNAALGLYAVSTDEITLKNQVILTSQRAGIQTTLTTEELTVDNAQGKIRTQETVVVKRPGQRFESKGVEFDNNTGQVKTLGPVKFRIEATP